MSLLVIAYPAFANAELNPYNSLLYGELRSRGITILEFGLSRAAHLQIPDILHLHWPENLVLKPRWGLRRLGEFLLFHFYLRVIRLRGGRIVWTAHNAFPHDKPRTRLNLLLWKRFLAKLDGIVYLSNDSRRRIEAEFPVLGLKPSAVIPHGHYIDWVSRVNTTQPPARLSRQTLGIPEDAKVVLSFGLIRKYKGVDLLVEEFKHVDPRIHLVVAGYTSRDELRQRIQASAQGQPNIHCLLRRMADNELTALLKLCDMVALPYKAITNSGAALLALSAERPVLGPNLGSLPELQARVGEDWVRLYEGPVSHVHITAALDWMRAPRRALDMQPFSWPAIASDTLGFYRALRSRVPR